MDPLGKVTDEAGATRLGNWGLLHISWLYPYTEPSISIDILAKSIRRAAYICVPAKPLCELVTAGQNCRNSIAAAFRLLSPIKHLPALHHRSGRSTLQDTAAEGSRVVH